MAQRVTSGAVHEYSDTPTRWNAFSCLSTEKFSARPRCAAARVPGAAVPADSTEDLTAGRSRLCAALSPLPLSGT